jgi:hypothetical protein
VSEEKDNQPERTPLSVTHPHLAEFSAFLPEREQRNRSRHGVDRDQLRRRADASHARCFLARKRDQLVACGGIQRAAWELCDAKRRIVSSSS